jgi:hypothetical protein
MLHLNATEGEDGAGLHFCYPVCESLLHIFCDDIGNGAVMARLARIEVFAPDEIAIIHVMNRVVRRCFLLGTDPVTGKNFDHRKNWIEQQLRRQSACFGIDLLGFSILSNHFHLILRSRPDVVCAWDDMEVARRWLMLCPLRKDSDGVAAEPSPMELNTIVNDPRKLQTIRVRLSDIGWWMHCLSQHIAIRANREDNENGRFWNLPSYCPPFLNLPKSEFVASAISA